MYVRHFDLSKPFPNDYNIYSLNICGYDGHKLVCAQTIKHAEVAMTACLKVKSNNSKNFTRGLTFNLTNYINIEKNDNSWLVIDDLNKSRDLPYLFVVKTLDEVTKDPVKLYVITSRENNTTENVYDVLTSDKFHDLGGPDLLLNTIIEILYIGPIVLTYCEDREFINIEDINNDK